MANLVLNESGVYSVRFRLGRYRFNRSLETTGEREARDEKNKIERTLRLIKQGDKELPEGATPSQIWTFLRSAGKAVDGPMVTETTTLETLCKKYFEALPEGAKEESSLKTERTHVANLKRHLGASKPIRSLGVEELQRYVRKRQKDKGHRGQPIRADTIRKELQTFRQLWSFASDRKLVNGRCPVDGVALPKADEKEPFKTWEEIESIIARGGYSEAQQSELWDCLFLREAEILDLLEHVRKTASHPFVYPMFAFAAFTGARRSEILRSQIDDFRLAEGYVWLREKKRRTDKRVSFRDVAVHTRLKAVMTEWFAQHPGGRFTVCAPPGMIRSRVKSTDPQPLTASQAHDHFKRTLKDSKWEVVRGFHVLRHSFASNLARRGVHQSIVDRWLGHQTQEMRDRYRHLFPEEKKEAIDSLTFGIDRLFRG